MIEILTRILNQEIGENLMELKKSAAMRAMRAQTALLHHNGWSALRLAETNAAYEPGDLLFCTMSTREERHGDSLEDCWKRFI